MLSCKRLCIVKLSSTLTGAIPLDAKLKLACRNKTTDFQCVKNSEANYDDTACARRFETVSISESRHWIKALLINVKSVQKQSTMKKYRARRKKISAVNEVYI